MAIVPQTIYMYISKYSKEAEWLTSLDVLSIPNTNINWAINSVQHKLMCTNVRIFHCELLSKWMIIKIGKMIYRRIAKDIKVNIRATSDNPTPTYVTRRSAVSCSVLICIIRYDITTLF